MKICKKCNKTKSLDEFYGNATRPDGLQSYCKECSNSASAAYYVANRDKLIADKNTYRANNHEKVRAVQVAWRAANPDKASAACASWRTANPDVVRTYHQNRRARKRMDGGKLSKDLAAKLFKLQKGKCPCCGKPLGSDYHMDHKMPLALGGANEDWNIQLLRKRCNSQKSAAHPIDFMQSRGFLI
jgi:5-methylcytosine-specific restriction endonuclease McrA